MHVYVWRHLFLIPEIQQTVPYKISIYLEEWHDIGMILSFNKFYFMGVLIMMCL